MLLAMKSKGLAEGDWREPNADELLVGPPSPLPLPMRGRSFEAKDGLSDEDDGLGGAATGGGVGSAARPRAMDGDVPNAVVMKKLDSLETMVKMMMKQMEARDKREQIRARDPFGNPLAA